MSKNELEEHVEKIKNDGYTIVEDVLSPEECKIVDEKLDKINEKEIKCTPFRIPDYCDTPDNSLPSRLLADGHSNPLVGHGWRRS